MPSNGIRALDGDVCRVVQAASPAASKPAAPTPEATENLPPAEASPPKVRTMQVRGLVTGTGSNA